MGAKVYIAVCSCRDWKPQFGVSLCGLISHAPKTEGLDSVFLNVLQGTSVLPRARQLAMEDAIKGGFTHILMLDDDMKFTPDLLESLLNRNAPVVGLNYARKDGSGGTMACDLEGKPVCSKGKTGIEEIGWIGFGGILIDLEAIKPISKPYFEMRWLEERSDFMGEDFYFSMKAQSEGVQIYIDHDASAKCAHIGDFQYREA